MKRRTHKCDHTKASSFREDKHKPILHCVHCGAQARVDWSQGGKITMIEPRKPLAERVPAAAITNETWRPIDNLPMNSARFEPRRVGNIAFGQQEPGTQFFKVTIEFETGPSAMLKVQAIREGDIRASLAKLAPRITRDKVQNIRIRECGQFEAVLIGHYE
jgi:hypothetical protein